MALLSSLLVTSLLVTSRLVAPPDPADAAARAVAGLSSDPAPPKITNDRHYYTSNERRLDLFEPHVAGIGGAYVGVGADQSYILAAWARAELMVLIDFDQRVVDLHDIYAIFFTHAADGEAFAQLWSEPDTARAVLTTRTPDETRRTELIAVYEQAQPKVAKRIKIMATKLRKANTHWFIDDADQYRHLANLFARGRVVALRGDFTKNGVVRATGGALRDAGVALGVLYLSNIEQYFMYGKDYKANILALPLTARSVVLRTLPGRPAGFQYLIQAGDNLRAWMGAKNVYSVYRLVGLTKGEYLVASVSRVLAQWP